MIALPVGQEDPRVATAISELRSLIEARYPDATFAVFEGEYPDGIYLEATVDVEDRDEVIDLFIDRMVDLQVDEGLPVYVTVVRPPERIAAMLEEQRRNPPAWLERVRLP